MMEQIKVHTKTYRTVCKALKISFSFLFTHAIFEIDGSSGSAGAASGSGGASKTRTTEVDDSTRTGATAREPVASRFFAVLSSLHLQIFSTF